MGLHWHGASLRGDLLGATHVCEAKLKTLGAKASNSQPLPGCVSGCLQ